MDLRTLPRPTVDQIRDALKWWNSLPKAAAGEPQPGPEQRKVREALRIGALSSIGADNIARYWLVHIQPHQPPAQLTEE